MFMDWTTLFYINLHLTWLHPVDCGTRDKKCPENGEGNFGNEGRRIFADPSAYLRLFLSPPLGQESHGGAAGAHKRRLHRRGGGEGEEGGRGGGGRPGRKVQLYGDKGPPRARGWGIERGRPKRRWRLIHWPFFFLFSGVFPLVRERPRALTMPGDCTRLVRSKVRILIVSSSSFSCTHFEKAASHKWQSCPPSKSQ